MNFITAEKVKLTGSIAIALMLLIVTNGAAQDIIPNLGSARSGTSGFQFTKISVDPRSSAMGNSAVADIDNASAMYWNPAMVVQQPGNEVMLSQTSYFIDIDQYYLAYSYNFGSIAIGAAMQYLNSGEMEETTEFDKFGTGRTFRTLHYSAGLTVSQKMTEYFSYGVTAKFLHERIEEVDLISAAIDMGFFYRVTDTGLRFSVGVNNFGLDNNPIGTTVRPTLNGQVQEEDFAAVTLPTTFILGAAYDVYQDREIDWLLTTQLLNPSDNSERFSLGTEVGYLGRFFGRMGYQFGKDDVMLPSFGIGVKQKFYGVITRIDVSYSAYEVLGNITRFGFNFSF